MFSRDMAVHTPPQHCKAVVLGCRTTTLSKAEKDVYKKHSPFGLILFSRNCRSREQVINLVQDFRDCVGWCAPVLIDQEGGRNQRLLGKSEKKLRKLLSIGENISREVSFDSTDWTHNYPSMKDIGDVFLKDPQKGMEAAYLAGLALGSVIADLGINVNIAPVLDVLSEQTHAIIGDRSFGSNPQAVAVLGRLVMQGLMSAGVIPVTKHIPGHGKAVSDSHVQLPVVQDPVSKLLREDFIPFVHNNDAPITMIAHLVYEAIDGKAASQSAALHTYIRKKLLNEGILITDCIFMNALKGSLPNRAKACISAGMDVICASHGSAKEKDDIASVIPVISEDTRSRYVRAVKHSLTLRQNMRVSRTYDITDYSKIYRKLMKALDRT